MGDEEMFAIHRSIDNLVEAAGGCASLLGGGVAVRELGLRRSLGGRRLGKYGRGAADQGERKKCNEGAQHFSRFHFNL